MPFSELGILFLALFNDPIKNGSVVILISFSSGDLIVIKFLDELVREGFSVGAYQLFDFFWIHTNAVSILGLWWLLGLFRSFLSRNFF